MSNIKNSKIRLIVLNTPSFEKPMKFPFKKTASPRKNTLTFLFLDIDRIHNPKPLQIMLAVSQAEP
jgi:hypothetical protein